VDAQNRSAFTALFVIEVDTVYMDFGHGLRLSPCSRLAGDSRSL
jgi:hypothetical protein